MLMNPSRLLFLTTLTLGTFINITSNSWLGCWIGLEINLLSFIPVMSSYTRYSSEASLKYFLVQALASSVLLLSVIVSQVYSSFGSPLLVSPDLLILSSLLMKMGAAPFHFWFPGVVEGLNWNNALILMTWQKIAPFILVSYLISPNFLIITSIGLCGLVGAAGGLNQTSIRKVMAYSSINHMGWMLGAMLTSIPLWTFYFIIYSLISISLILMFNHFQLNHLNQMFTLTQLGSNTKMIMFCSFLSLGGLPPFLGFLPKWLVIQSLTTSGFLPLVTWMVMFTLVTLYFYTRVSYSAFMLTHSTLKWHPGVNNLTFMIVLSNSLSIGGLVFCGLAPLLM